MKKVIVTGGAGFVGSHLVNKLINAGHRVHVIDNLSNGKESWLDPSERLSLQNIDILDTVTMKKVFQEINPKLVYHLAAEHFIPACERDPEFAFRTNVEGTQSVISACKSMVDRPKLVFASTGAIYNPHLETPLNENTDIMPLDIYGTTKHVDEQILKLYSYRDNAEVKIARLFNVAGRRETNPHIIPIILQQIKKGQRKIQLGNLKPRRDYIHVEDVATGLYTIGVNDSQGLFDIYNLGSGVEFSVAELVKLCESVVGFPIEIETVEFRKRKFDRMSQLADIIKMKSIFSWEPKHDLKKALEDVWVEYHQNDFKYFE